MARVVLENVTKSFPERRGNGSTVVHGVNLDIADGEFMVLVGPSGCGKSTTLRMIAGLEDITSGTVKIDQQTVNELQPKDRDIAMVFQSYALYPHMTVYENMAFGLKLRKLPASETDRRVRDAARQLGLEDLLERKPKALSGGQRQRVALGRAIVRKPKVFLFDEPLSNLDAQMRLSTRAELSRLHTQLGATMIYVTHDQVEAMTLGDRICVLRDGRVQQVAAPLELYHSPVNRFVASFIGSPPMNFLSGTIEAAGDRLRFRENNPNLPCVDLLLDRRLSVTGAKYIGRKVLFGIRPEHVQEARSDDLDLEASHAATIEIAEALGSETYLHFNTGAHRLLARVIPDSRYITGRNLLLAFNTANAHLFDPETEMRIGAN